VSRACTPGTTGPDQTRSGRGLRRAASSRARIQAAAAAPATPSLSSSAKAAQSSLGVGAPRIEEDAESAVVFGTSPISSSSSASALCSGGVPEGIRKPARYQLDGRSQPGRRSSASACPAPGPTRVSFRASTRPVRTSGEVAGAEASMLPRISMRSPGSRTIVHLSASF
jgi:hypothetical protein